MNEEQKNIETCLAEEFLSEVANVPTDPQFRSLVDEALDPLKRQALRQAGYDGYDKVAGTHQPYTFTSQVKQMKSDLILLLRRLWRYPFGRGTTASSAAGSVSAGSAAGSSAAAPIRSLADMWQHYITRLKGNPEYGIPSRLSSLTDLPDAPALLEDRKIGGVPEAADGISLVRLICSTSAASSVTEIVDTNVGWTMDKAPSNAFPNAKKVTIRCKTLHASPSAIFQNAEEFDFPALDHIDTGESGHPQINIFYGANIKRINLPEVTQLRVINASYQGLFYNITSLCEILTPNCTSVSSAFDNNYPRLFYSTPGVYKWVLGKIINAYNLMTNGDFVNLIHFEIGAGTAVSLNLKYWTATNALDASRTDLIEEGSTAANNIQQFLQNFKTYIAERLTDKGSGLTLTLSQEVRNAIHAAEDEYGIENIIITKKGWTISPAPN